MEHIIKDISQKISNDKEPLYKVTFAIPTCEDDDCGNLDIGVKIKSYIYNYSTYKENCIEYDKQTIEDYWDRFIKKEYETIRLLYLNEDEPDNQEVYCRKLSVELLN